MFRREQKKLLEELEKRGVKTGPTISPQNAAKNAINKGITSSDVSKANRQAENLRGRAGLGKKGGKGDD